MFYFGVFLPIWRKLWKKHHLKTEGLWFSQQLYSHHIHTWPPWSTPVEFTVRALQCFLFPIRCLPFLIERTLPLLVSSEVQVLRKTNALHSCFQTWWTAFICCSLAFGLVLSACSWVHMFYACLLGCGDLFWEGLETYVNSAYKLAYGSSLL